MKNKKIELPQEQLLKKLNKKEALQTIKSIEKRDGLLTPTAVVEEARSELSPIHEAFDWDDSSAAEKFRLFQARVLINTFRVVIGGKSLEQFHNVRIKIKNETVQGYVSVERVLDDEELKHQVLEYALKDLSYWQEKYKNLAELKGVINYKKLDQTKKKLLGGR